MSVQTEDVEGYDEACHATVHTMGRQEDYLLIPQSILARNAAYQPTYYCGANDNLVVYGKQLATCSILDLLLILVYLQPSLQPYNLPQHHRPTSCTSPVMRWPSTPHRRQASAWLIASEHQFSKVAVASCPVKWPLD